MSAADTVVRVAHAGVAGSAYAAFVDELVAGLPGDRTDVVRVPATGEDAALNRVRNGDLAGLVVTSGPLARLEPRFHIAGLPCLHSTREERDSFWQSSGEEIARGLLPHGLRAIAHLDGGVRHVVTNRLTPPTRPLDGLRLRSLELPYLRRWFALVGCSTSTVGMAAVPGMVASGELDGVERSFANVVEYDALRWARAVLTTAHLVATSFFVVSERWWSTLPEYERQQIAKLARSRAFAQRQLYAQRDREAEALVRTRGVAVAPPDRTGLAEAARTVWDEAVDEIGAIASPLEAALTLSRRGVAS